MAKKVYSAKPHTLKDNKESKLSREAEQYFKNKNRKNRQPSKDREKIEDFARNVLFKNFQEALDNAQTSNTYLFELLKKHRVKKELHDGLYKINIIKKNEKGIVCSIKSTTNYEKRIFIKTEDIMATKNDKLEEAYKGGKESDFLEEFQYNDSCIIRVHKKKMEKIDLKNVLEEIKKYVNEKRGFDEKNSKTISSILRFLGESKNDYARTYLKDITKFSEQENGQNKELEMKVFGTTQKEEIRKALNNRDKKKEYQVERKEQLRKTIVKLFEDPEIPIYIHQENDIDNQSALFLLRKSKIFNSDKKVIKISQGDEKNIDKGIFIDIGKTVSGFKVIGNKIIFSEHDDGSDRALFTKRPNSTTHMIYTLFKDLGLFPDENLGQMERFVEFVDKVDSMNYQVASVDYKNNDKTLIGLHKKLLENGNTKYIYDYFKGENNTGFEILPEDYMKDTKVKDKNGENVPLKTVSEKKTTEIKKNMENFDDLKKRGYELNYKLTSFIVDIEEKLKDGPQVAGYNNGGKAYGFFTIYPKKKNIYIFSPKPFPAKVEGFDTTQRHFLVINNPSISDLDKILEKFGMDKNSKDGLHKEIKKYFSELTSKGKNKSEKSVKETLMQGNNSNFIIKEVKQKKEVKTPKISPEMSRLPELKAEEIKIGESYIGIVNNVRNKLAFVTLDKQNNFNGILHESSITEKPDNYIKSLKKGNEIKVKVIKKEKGEDQKLKIQFELA